MLVALQILEVYSNITESSYESRALSILILIVVESGHIVQNDAYPHLFAADKWRRNFHRRKIQPRGIQTRSVLHPQADDTA